MIDEDVFFDDVKGALNKIYPHAYFSSWTGAEIHELTDSKPNDYTLFSNQFESDQVVSYFNQKVFLKKTPKTTAEHILTIESPNGFFRVSDIHQTVVDCFFDVKLAGGKEIIKDVIESYKSSENADFTILIQCAKKSNMPLVVSSLLKLSSHFEISGDTQ